MHLWQTHLEVRANREDIYLEVPRTNLINMFSCPRKFVLEVGCSRGATGVYCKEKFPDVIYWGIEPNQSAAHVASSRLDRVLVGMSDEFNLAEEGVQLGQIDGVIFADVIEHMYNPWKALADLKPYLSENAESITSIPCVRNIWLLNEIASGRFTYQESGLLDVTHIRFFTWLEVANMMRQCGYEINNLIYGVDDRLWDTYNTHKERLPCTVDYEDVSIRNVTSESDLLELCSIQFYSRAVLIQ